MRFLHCAAVALAVAACATSAPSTSRPAAGASRPASAPTTINVALTATGEDIVARANAQRRTLALEPLRRSTALMQAAQLQAEQMAAAERMSHELPGEHYPTLGARLGVVGYRWSTSGENIAEGYADAAGVISGWMKSAGHRENLLSTRFAETGAGVATGKNGRKYYAQVFATPR